MPEAIRGLIERIGEPQRVLIERVGGPRRLLIVLVGLAAVALIWGISYWATAPSWVPLFPPGMALTDVGQITARLDEAGVKYRLERGGSLVLVEEDELARARVLLAQAGLPSSGRPGFELFDRPSWGMTDFTQRVNYRRALEGELERTIGRMQGIEGAQVHLALDEATVFRRSRERPLEASVVLRLKPGVRPSSEMVEGIAFLVASSVDGLASENVTILDDAGRVLSAPAEGEGGAGLTRRQLKLRSEIERYLEMKAEELLTHVVGPGNARVRVAATLDFDRVDRTTESLDPDGQVATREARSEIVPGPGVPGAGQVVTETLYELTRTVERVTGSAGAVKRLTIAVLVNHRKVGTGAAARYEPWTPEELAQLEGLVRNATGLDPARGDAISVVSVPFEADAAPAPAGGGGWMETVWPIVEQTHRPLIALLGIVLAFVLGLRLVRAVREPTAEAEPTAPQQVEAPEEVTALLTGEAPAAEEQEEREEKKAPQVPQGLVHERPDLAVRMLRAWLKEG
ncbi:MAG TPA: flagellar basal-body MS-ring/collar protein FliF [Longimicrobiales bacterium]